MRPIRLILAFALAVALAACDDTDDAAIDAAADTGATEPCGDMSNMTAQGSVDRRAA